MDPIIFAATKQKEFTYTMVVRQGDITPYGSASFINYVRWYNMARDTLLQWHGLGIVDSLRNVIETEVSFCNIQFKREIVLQDEIIIKINSSNIKEKEFTLLFTIIRKDDAVLISLGKQKISFLNFETGEVLDLPQPLVQDILKPIEVNEKLSLFKY